MVTKVEDILITIEVYSSGTRVRHPGRWCDMDSDSVPTLRERLHAFIEGADLNLAGREACVQAGAWAYENARNDGLCNEGAWECALEAVRGLVTET